MILSQSLSALFVHVMLLRTSWILFRGFCFCVNRWLDRDDSWFRWTGISKQSWRHVMSHSCTPFRPSPASELSFSSIYRKRIVVVNSLWVGYNRLLKPTGLQWGRTKNIFHLDHIIALDATGAFGPHAWTKSYSVKDEELRGQGP